MPGHHSETDWSDTPRALTMDPMAHAAHHAAVRVLAGERMRQVAKEGWTPAHDDTHTDGELAMAASAYAHHSACQSDACLDLASAWPWEEDFLKPGAPIEDVVKAGALILAELERRIRAGEKPKDPTR